MSINEQDSEQKVLKMLLCFEDFSSCAGEISWFHIKHSTKNK